MKLLGDRTVLETGDTLPNGAQVLLERSGVVLAVGKKAGVRENGAIELGRVEFITWRWDGKDPRTTTWGHYFSNLTRAATDFEERVNNEERRSA